MACCGLFCIRLKSPEQLHFVASYSSGVLWFVIRLKSPEQLHFVASFKWRVVVCFARWQCCGCCGLSCIRLNSPEPLHFAASYSSGVLWFVLLIIQVRLKSPEQLHFVALFKWRVVCFASG